MTSPFVHDYLQVGLAADQSANPVTDTDLLTNPEILVLRFNTDTKEFVLWDPEDEEYIQISTSGSVSLAAENVSFDQTTYSLGPDVQDALEKIYQELLGIVSGEPGVAQNTFLVEGGQVVWTAGFTFNVSAASYYIDGVFTESAEQTIILDAAHATLNRIDVIALDNTGTVVKVTGTAAAEPSEPDVDPGTQLKLTFVLVEALATEPDIAEIEVYLENAGDPDEWDGTTSGSGFTLNSATSPRTGAVCIDGTSVANAAYAQFEKGSGSVDVNDYDFLVLYLQSKSTWANNRGLQVSWRDNGVLRGTAPQIRRTGTYGFESSNTVDYQQIAIPTSDFALVPGTEVNQLRLTDFGGAINFRIDDIRLVGGGATPPPATGITQEFADARYLQIADADERAQDAVGAILVDGTTVNFTYNDGGPSITAEVQNIDTTHFAANIIDADDTLSANSDLRLATQQAVKAYVDAAVIAGGYTNEMAQDAVGGMVDASLTYVDATPLLQRAALTGDVQAAAGSNATSITRVVQLQVSDPNGDAITTGDGKAYFRVNSLLNGFNLTAVAAALIVDSSSGIPTVQIHNVTQAADMLTTKLTIDEGELDSKDATDAAVIDTGNDDVATGDMLRIDIDVAGTDAVGLIVELTFQKP